MKLEMLATLFIAALPLRPVVFLEQPLAIEVKKGIAIYRMGKGLDRVLQSDKQVLTTRTVHLRVEETEKVVWLSPALVSRWLGYLWASEKWPEGELQRRWDNLRAALDGRLTFIVELADFPTGSQGPDPYAEYPSQGKFSSATFLFTAGGSQLPLPPGPTGAFGLSREPQGGSLTPWNPVVLRRVPQSARLVEIESREPLRSTGVGWAAHSPFAHLLGSGSDKGWESPTVPLGEYSKAWFLVQTDRPESLYLLGDMQIRVLGLGREKVANFRLIG